MSAIYKITTVDFNKSMRNKIFFHIRNFTLNNAVANGCHNETVFTLSLNIKNIADIKGKNICKWDNKKNKSKNII